MSKIIQRIEKDDGLTETYQAGRSVIAYHVRYADLELLNQVPNRFIVYILQGRTQEDKEAFYVGKSVLGKCVRPSAHENKGVFWTDCYIITDTLDAFLNDGTCQYLEHKFRKLLEQKRGSVIVTEITSNKTCNHSDVCYCEDVFETAIELLKGIGLNLTFVDQTAFEQFQMQDPVPPISYLNSPVVEMVKMLMVNRTEWHGSIYDIIQFANEKNLKAKNLSRASIGKQLSRKKEDLLKYEKIRLEKTSTAKGQFYKILMAA